jgi:hypothetical protein
MFIAKYWEFVTRRTVIKLQLKWLSCFALFCRGEKLSRFLTVSNFRCYEFHYFYNRSNTDIRREKNTLNFSFILKYHLTIPGSVSIHAKMIVIQYCSCIRPPCTKQHAINTYRWNRIRLTAVITSILDEQERSASCSGRFNTVEESLVLSRNIPNATEVSNHARA